MSWLHSHSFPLHASFSGLHQDLPLCLFYHWLVRKDRLDSHLARFISAHHTHTNCVFYWMRCLAFPSSPLSPHPSLLSPLPSLSCATHSPSPPLPSSPLSCHWMLRGVMVVVSVSDISTACTGLLLQKCRSFHRFLASDLSVYVRTVFLKAAGLRIRSLCCLR